MLITASLDTIIDQALNEDLGVGDVTTRSVVPRDQKGLGQLIAKEPLTVAGLDVLSRVFQRFAQPAETKSRCVDGADVASGELIAEVHGPMETILMGERVALNLLQRLCGTASLTRAFVKQLPSDSKTKIVDTRKTTPNLRELERYAVRCGGGFNHRARLDGGLMIKDNHIAACGSITAAVSRARSVEGPALRIEVEVTDLTQVEEALEAGAEVIMLDNMDLDVAEAAVRHIGDRALVEFSGGVTLERIASIASIGVDFISVGALTHSARARDISLKVSPC